MAYIKDITFWHYGKNEGLLCDRCGAYITNVYTVTYSDGLIARYGMECFNKLRNSGKLSEFGVKLLMKTLKYIKQWNEELRKWEGVETAEQAEANGINLYAFYNYENWKDRTLAEYKDFEINKVIPNRLDGCKKELERFKKINFTI